MQPDRLHRYQAQENPDFEEQPDSAPDGMELDPPEIRKLEAEMVFLTLLLLHLLQVTSPAASAEVTMASKRALHSWQRYS